MSNNPTESSKRKVIYLPKVLGLLAIIGILLAIILTPIIKNMIKDRQYKNAYNQAYVDLNIILGKALNDNKIKPRTGNYDPINDIANFKVLESYFPNSKDYSGKIPTCWPTTQVKSFWGAPISKTAGFTDSKGRTWVLWQESKKHTYASVLVDTNGLKEPNIYGKDRFPLQGYIDKSSNTIGLITHFIPQLDYTKPSKAQAAMCPSTPCYYRSWATSYKL